MSFEIDIADEQKARLLPDAPRRLAIRSNDIVFTRLMRSGDNEPDDYLEASAPQLAFFFVDNWWRLVAECAPASGQTAEWRLAHDLSSMAECAWPRMAIWGEGDRVGLSSRSDPPGVVGPVRYLTDALTYIPAATFENAALTFVAHVASAKPAMASDAKALAAQLRSLQEERADGEVTAWRRLEAQLGYDVDEAPEALMEALDAFTKEYGASAVAEAALAVPGPEAATTLKTEIATALGQHWQCDLTRTALIVGPIRREARDAPWELAERSATAVRAATGYAKGPLSNGALADICNVRATAFRTDRSSRSVEHAYGLRLNTGRKRGEVVSLAASWSGDRRFEFARALGDAIWTQGERLGPITRAKSERQKFQRAFAQSLLCPYEDLVAYIGGKATDGAISAAARHFLVSERVVRTLLVNKHNLVRARLSATPRPIASFGDTIPFEDAVEAA